MSVLKKKAEVIMLPTEDTNPVNVPFLKLPFEHLMKHLAGGQFRKLISKGAVPQHLYFVDDSSIKEPCYAYSKSKNNIQWLSETRMKVLKSDNWKKVIATTDISLQWTIDKSPYPMEVHSLPQPDVLFIISYIKAFNEGSPIKFVMVDYIPNWLPEMFEPGDYPEVPFKYELLIDKNNTITITRCKNSWSREELQKLFDSYGDNFAAKIIWEDILKL